MERVQIFRAAEGRGIAIIPDASHHEAEAIWRNAWGGPANRPVTPFVLGDWRIDVGQIDPLDSEADPGAKTLVE